MCKHQIAPQQRITNILSCISYSSKIQIMCFILVCLFSKIGGVHAWIAARPTILVQSALHHPTNIRHFSHPLLIHKRLSHNKQSDPKTIAIFDQSLLIFQPLLKFLQSMSSVILIAPLAWLFMSTCATAHDTIQDPFPHLSSNTEYTSFLISQMESTNSNSQSSVIDWDNIKLSLPTDEHPIIQLDQSKRTDSTIKVKEKISTEKAPLVQGEFQTMSIFIKKKQMLSFSSILVGLIYILDHREWFEEQRRDPSQILVLTVSSTSQSNSVVAGAKLPLMDVSRFPIQVQLEDSNFRPTLSKEERSLLKTQDFKVTASICPMKQEERIDNVMVKTIPCQDSNDISFQAMGIAKVLPGDIFGLDAEDSVRAPFSLALSAVTMVQQ